jgi:hypothetical protein
MANNIEPLAPNLWFQRLAVIAAGELGSVENSLRHASHLILLTPNSFPKSRSANIGRRRHSRLYLRRATSTPQARQLVVPPANLLVQANPDAKSLRAVIACAILKRPVEGTGETAAAAILDAWTSWLITLRLEFGVDLEQVPLPPPAWARPDRGSSVPGRADTVLLPASGRTGPPPLASIRRSALGESRRSPVRTVLERVAVELHNAVEDRPARRAVELQQRIGERRRAVDPHVERGHRRERAGECLAARRRVTDARRR